MSTTPTHALFQDGIVWDLFEADPRLHASCDVRAVADVRGIARGWRVRADGTFVAPPTDHVPTSVLLAHAERRLAQAAAVGITVDVGAPGGALQVSADTTADGKANILGLLAAYTAGLKAEADSTTWYQSGGQLALSREQLLTIAGAVLAHIDAAYAAWRSAVAGVAAEPPTITDPAGIDALFAPIE